MTHPFYQSLDYSDKRRVLIVGDIHGEFLRLVQKLKELNFDPEQGDMLISVGDLVDRGPYSEDFEWWIAQPWFKWVVGNHELQPRGYLLGYESRENVERNGGGWLLAKSQAEIERLASVLEHGPLALEVRTPGGRRIGITHADTHSDWDLLVQQCADPTQERYVVNMLVDSRTLITQVNKKKRTIAEEEVRVKGIDHVFHGHTPLKQPITFANRSWIDTGAFDGGPLTIVDADVWIDLK